MKTQTETLNQRLLDLLPLSPEHEVVHVWCDKVSVMLSIERQQIRMLEAAGQHVSLLDDVLSYESDMKFGASWSLVPLITFECNPRICACKFVDSPTGPGPTLTPVDRSSMDLMSDDAGWANPESIKIIVEGPDRVVVEVKMSGEEPMRSCPMQLISVGKQVLADVINGTRKRKGVSPRRASGFRYS